MNDTYPDRRAEIVDRVMELDWAQDATGQYHQFLVTREQPVNIGDHGRMVFSGERRWKFVKDAP